MLALRGARLGVVETPFADAAAAEKYLKKELKIELHKKQQDSLIKAIKTPDVWLGERKTAMDAIAKSLSKPYTDAIDRYTEYYPVDEAIQMAGEDIKPLYEIEKRYMDLTLPGANQLYTGALLENQGMRDQAHIQANALTDRSQWKKEYKAKRKAKKASKAAKSTA